MLNSFSELFSFSSTPTQRKYQPKPRRANPCNLVQRKKFNQTIRNQAIFEGILDFLATPIQNWALQYQKNFEIFALHQWIYNQIISFSTSFNQKSSADLKQTLIMQQLIKQIRIQNNMKLPNFRAPRISLHNIFVLMTQYKVMEKIIFDLNTQQLEMMIDGLSFIYFHGVGKVENVGEILSEEEITTGVGGWGTIDELTCCIHFVTTHTKLYKTYPQKEKYSLMKQIQILEMPCFIKVYDCLQSNKKIDNIVNSIPMFMQFLQIFVKHKNNAIPGCEFVMNVKWLSGLGFRIMQIIQYNINKLLLVNNEFSQQFSAQELEVISQLQNVNEQNEKQQSQIVLKLMQKALLLKQTQGHINSRILFSFAFHHLYTVNFMLKLTRKVLQLSKCHYTVYKETCQKVCQFLHKLFESVWRFQFTLPQGSIVEVCEIIKIISNEGEYLFGDEEKQVQGFQFLYGQQISSGQLKQFSKNLQRSQRFGCYHNHKPRPHLNSQSQMLGQQIAQDYNVMLQTNENSIFYYILSAIYKMKMDYLSIIYTVLKNADKRYLQMLQFYFIKNELLHFLVENQHQVQLKDKKNMKMLYSTVAWLVKGNLVAYAILDQVIVFQLDQFTSKSQFVQDLKKHFSQTKQLMLTLFSDTISDNVKHLQSPCFCPIVLQKLLYPSQHQLHSSNLTCSSRHQVWISYIFNVILHQLYGFKKKMEQIEAKKRKINIYKYENLLENLGIVENIEKKSEFDQEIYDWITLIIFLHIDHTQVAKDIQGVDQELILSEFVMTYLTTILAQAIKWKYKNESQRMVEFQKILQDWQNHYTDLILTHQNNEDFIEKQYGPVIKFLYLKRWNKKIIKAIKLYLFSLEDYNKQERGKRRSLQKVRSLKNIVQY